MKADSIDKNESDSTKESLWLREKNTFEKAKTFLKPNAVFRLVTYLYSERKLVVVFWAHFIATMIVWAHFARIKWADQEKNVPEDASHYWLKRITPPLEFGSMHAILFQMALIPLTMSRFSIAALSGSFIDRFVPLNRSLCIHIHLGYTMVAIVFLATIVFFIFFGILCSDGEQQFCDKFTSEIMITGYGILSFLLIIAGTSYFRHRIPYETFYAVHQSVFLLYAVTILHTLDGSQRSGAKSRSQTFGWFSTTLLYYFCDRAAMHINHKYRARVVSSSMVTGGHYGSKMIILKLQRPALFDFKPGQYAYLRHSEIDAHFHPFSIASGPSSSYLEFYVEVLGEGSWTDQLWNMLETDQREDEGGRRLEIEVMGPYGTGLAAAKIEDFSHVLAIGSGTGIVPILSLFKQHVRKLVHLDPDVHSIQLRSQQKRMMRVERAALARKGSFAAKLTRSCSRMNGVPYQDAPSRREIQKASIISSMTKLDVGSNESATGPNNREMQLAAFCATRSIYGVVLLAVMPIMGLALIGFSISWNTLDPALIRRGMIDFLLALTIFFQVCFAALAFFVWDASQSLFSYTDMGLSLVTPFADWYWFIRYDTQGNLSPGEITLYCLLIGYMTLRLWSMTVKPRHRSWRTGAQNCGPSALDRLEIVWTTKSSDLVAEILPDINKIWDSLVTLWGKEKAQEACLISVFITDKDSNAVDMLRREICKMSLYRSGCIHFERPNFGKIIEDHTLEMICTRRNSYSLLAFCGSPALAQTIHQLKISNDMVAAMTGNKRHQMEFVSESYGGPKNTKKKRRNKQSKKGLRKTQDHNEGSATFVDLELSEEVAQGLTTRKVVNFVGEMESTTS